jgi:hypothetical protein
MPTPPAAKAVQITSILLPQKMKYSSTYGVIAALEQG